MCLLRTVIKIAVLFQTPERFKRKTIKKGWMKGNEFRWRQGGMQMRTGNGTAGSGSRN